MRKSPAFLSRLSTLKRKVHVNINIRMTEKPLNHSQIPSFSINHSFLAASLTWTAISNQQIGVYTVN